MNRPTLTELANKYGTDKGTTHARGAFGPLNYTPFYEKLFEGRRDDPLTLLEIGVAEGASLAMWREYFPKATIFGFDIRAVNPPVPDCITIRGSQSQVSDLEFLAGYGRFDIIIDDGSHQFGDQMLTLGSLYQHLKPGGLYCIEDLQAPFNKNQTRSFFLGAGGVIWEEQQRIVVLRK